mmetsp:Transcript_15791/g.38402  ORF Transcript_15791/g.38402 Transcript_15791/m.38402 type:complete len:392 (+) Transcript_15791:63-1238(+)
MVIHEHAKLNFSDVRPEARPAVEQWRLMADFKYKNRWYSFFDDERPATGASRPSSSNKKLPVKAVQTNFLKEAQKELDMANWNTMYQITNNSLGKSLEDVKKRAQGDKGRVLQPLIREIIKEASQHKVHKLIASMTPAEIEDFTILMRSLSITYEQKRNLFSSEYIVEYLPKKVDAKVQGAVTDPFASTLSAPVKYAPPRPAIRPRTSASRVPTPQMTKPAKPPKAMDGLLHWAGGAEGINSMYRTYFKKPGELYASVVAIPEIMSFSCGRVVPDSLVGDQYRNAPVFLSSDLESRHRLHQKKPTAQPSWHLLYKDGVTFTDKPGPHHPGEMSIYMRDFQNETTVMKSAKPTLDPFASSITIGMSDYPYHDTTYQGTICRSATMEYDRVLV